ncbi:MAG: hypothetical protein KAS32_19050 [Candidatus Peribacteraceae bacterium]|nr:hypothetical protein [Candidatus Peribacteraceae bacterium]
MSRVKIVLMCVFLIFVLTGCSATTEFSSYSTSINKSNETLGKVATAYFDKKAIDNAAVVQALSQGNGNETAIVLYTILSQQNDVKVLPMFQPQYVVKPTTGADVAKAVMTDTVPSLAKLGAGVYLGGKVIDGLSTAGTVLGAGATMINQNAGGDINGPSVIATESFKSELMEPEIDLEEDVVDDEAL